MGRTIGQAAALAGVSDRTLHPYDEIGLVSPRARTPAGYRSYDDSDLDRLRQALFYRGIGFSLAEIAIVLGRSDGEARSHLRRQHALLTRRIDTLQRMRAAIEREMEAGLMDIKLTQQERFEVLGDFRPEEFAQEAADRWGDTDAYQQSRRRTSSYTKQDWVTIKAEGAAIEADLVAAFLAGAAPDDKASAAIAERHRQHIIRWFYDCGHAAHRGLGEMYVADERFRDHYDDLAPGLAGFVRAAIIANAEQAGA